MQIERWMSHLAYVGVGAGSLVLAIALSTWVLRPSFSQTAPPAEAVAAPASGSVLDAQGMPADAATGTQATPPPPSTSEVLSENVSFLEPYVFDLRDGRRNPFRIPVQADANLMNMILPGTPLERYDLDELKLAGIMWDVKAPKAMILDPQGEVHVLGKDDRIGRKRGYIAVIREGEVVVVETNTFNGENAYSTRILRIGK